MKIHYLQHVHFETPANIFKWADQKGYQLTGTKLFLKEKLPDINQFDMLVIMGGPMGVYDEDKFPFLKEEKKFIEKAIKNNKKILGICLGAQLIADVLGARVYKNKEKEIGWFPVELTEEANKSRIFNDFPEKFTPFHWHGDTFEIPAGAIHTVRSEGCENQAFEYNDGRILSLQFHLEMNKESVRRLIENSVEELAISKGRFIQKPQDMISQKIYFEKSQELLFRLMDKFEKIE